MIITHRIILFSLLAIFLSFCGDGKKDQLTPKKKVISNSKDIKKLVLEIGVILPKKTEQAINFTLSDLNDKKVSLSDFMGKVVFLNFWATWCGPCIKEMPSMEKLHQTMKGQDFVMLGINLDKANNRNQVEAFVKALKVTFPILLDSNKVTTNLYPVDNIPATYIINKDGTKFGKVVGARGWADEDSINFFTELSKK